MSTRSRVVVALAVVAVVAGAIAAAVALEGQGSNLSAYVTPSGSMLPTIKPGSAIEVNVDRRHPRIGDIIVFHPPAGAAAQVPTCADPQEGVGNTAACDTPTPGESSELFVKRVVGGPGDTISIVNGHVIRNGVREPDSSYTEPCGDDSAVCSFPTSITIPQGDYFVLGDNRGASDDSRFWGPVPQAYIVGTVVR